MKLPTQRSLEKLRRDGYVPWVVETYAFGRRHDLYGFIDIVAIKPRIPGVLGIQCTSTSNVSARIKKIRNLPEYQLWLENGNHIQVWGWAKDKKTRVYVLTVKEIVD